MLGWCHGFGWIALCLLVANGCVRGMFPWPLLAATVSPRGPLGVVDRVCGAGSPRTLLAAMFPLNLPNVLTLVRIMLVPVLVVALLDETPNGDTIAAIVFAIAALTDGLDGYIARSRESITTFGKVMDPIADKLLIAAALISLVSLDRVAAWVAMVIIAREFAVSGLRVAAGQQGIVIPASLLGKAKTILQVAMVMALIAVDDTGAAWVQALVYLRRRDDADLGRRLLPQRPQADRGGAATAVGSVDRDALDLVGDPLEQLVAARAANVERAVEGRPVEVEAGEEDVDRPDRGRTAVERHVARPLGDLLGARNLVRLVPRRAALPPRYRSASRRRRVPASRRRRAVEPKDADPALGGVVLVARV